MKKKSMIFLLMFFLSISFSQAQLLNLYKAGDGLSRAKAVAADSGMVDPVLIGIGTTALDFELLEGVKLEYNIDDGTSNAWVYLFQAKDNPDERKAIGVVKILVLYLGMEIPLGDLPSLPFNPEGSIEDYQWIDSDEMADNLNDDAAFKDFKNNPNVSLNALALGINQIPPATIGEPYWIGMFTSDNGNIACYTHAVDGSVICYEITGVESEQQEGKISLYPNPANDMAIVTIPGKLQQSGSFMAIYSSNGDMAMELPGIPRNGETEQVIIPLSPIAAGSYYIMYYGPEGPMTLPLKIIR